MLNTISGMGNTSVNKAEKKPTCKLSRAYIPGGKTDNKQMYKQCLLYVKVSKDFRSQGIPWRLCQLEEAQGCQKKSSIWDS